MKKSNKKGFTIVELVVVIAIIAVLAAVLIPTFASLINKANESAYQQERTNQMIQDAVEKIDKGEGYMSWEDLEKAIAEALKNQNPGSDDLADKIIAIIKDKDSTGMTNEQLTAILEAIANKKFSDTQVKVILEKENINSDIINQIIAKLPQVGITQEDIAAAVKDILGETDTGLAKEINDAIAAALENMPTLDEDDITAIVDRIRAATVSGKQLIWYLNTALRKDNTVHPTMQSALDAVAKEGYVVSKINKSAADGNEILWDSKNDVFCYLVKGENQLKPSYFSDFPEKVTADLVDYFRIAKNVDVNSPYSTYLYEYKGTTTESQPLTTSKGLDVGNESVAYIKYENSSAQNVIIRTDGGTLTVNAPNDTVKHYENADSVNIVAVASASYHENGTVPFIQISKGRIEIEATGEKSKNASSI